MSPSASDTLEAFAADVIAFATAQDVDSVAKLISFFHLADLDRKAKIELGVEASGRLTLQIVAEGEVEEKILERA